MGEEGGGEEGRGKRKRGEGGEEGKIYWESLKTTRGGERESKGTPKEKERAEKVSHERDLRGRRMKRYSVLYGVDYSSTGVQE